jgi:hypothetical protein
MLRESLSAPSPTGFTHSTTVLSASVVPSTSGVAFIAVIRSAKRVMNH